MFIMKCTLSINSMENNEPIIRSIKPSAMSLKHSVSNLVDTAEITLPLTPYLRQDNTMARSSPSEVSSLTRATESPSAWAMMTILPNYSRIDNDDV